MTHTRPTASKQTLKPAALSLAIALCWGVVHAQTQNLPTGAQAIAGTATLNQVGKNLTVTTTNVTGGSHSAINWQSFSIGAGYATNFIQPNAASTSINRVVTNNPSQLFGTLSSNGKLVLVNPGGITVGKGAVIDTAGFTASAVGMTESDAKAGLLRFKEPSIGGNLDVHGRIISRGGDVTLIAPNVSVGSGAVIEAPDGTVTLAAGQSAQITGTGMDAVLLEVKAPTDSAINLGTLSGNAVGIFAATLKHSGLLQATGITTSGGSLSLVAPASSNTTPNTSAGGSIVVASSQTGGKVSLVSTESTVVDGSIRATQNTAAGETGGTIVVASAKSVLVADGANIDASGANGGGTVYIGGSWQGKDAAVLNALTTEVQKAAVINASATRQGNGGTIAVWSNGSTQTHGQLIARGAGAGGDGGKVETSGHTLVRTGLPDVTPGAGGKAGKWLIDPDDVVIQLGTAGTASPYNGNAASTQPTIYESEIETLGTSTDIEVLAQRSIKAVAGTGSDQTLVVDGHALKLGTTNALTGTQCTTTTACGIDMMAFTGGIQTKGGDLSVVTGFDINIGATALNNNGVQAAPILLPDINTSAPSGRTSNGAVLLSSSGNVTVNGNIVTKAASVGSGQAGDVHIQAAGTATLGSIYSHGGDFSATELASVTGGPIQSLNAGQVSVTANKVVLNGDIDAGAGSDNTNATTTTFAFAPPTTTRTVGELMGRGGDVNITGKGDNLASGEASVVFAKTASHTEVNTASGGPNAPVSSGPGFQGGNVTIEALKGSIDTGARGIKVVATGGNGNRYTAHSGSGPIGQGGRGGTVTFRAMDNTLTGDGIRGDGLDIRATGGSGGRFNLSGQAADWGQGGQGGNVTVETAGRIALNNSVIETNGGTGSLGGNAGSVRLEGQKGIASDSLDIYANGGYGQTDALGALAQLAEGGKGGQVEINVGSGSLSKLSNTATSGSLAVQALGGDFSGYHGDTTMGGDAGYVRLSGSHTSQILGEVKLNLSANGGTGSTYTPPTTRLYTGAAPTPTSSGKGGTVEVEMGSITLGSNSSLSANGGTNPNTQSGDGTGGKIRLLALNGSISESANANSLGLASPINISASSGECSSPDSCSVVMEAYNGGIDLQRAGKVAAKRLSLQTTVSAGSGGTFVPNSVSIAQTDVAYLRGSVSGNLTLDNINLNNSALTNESLTLGYDNGNGLLGLSVSGTAQITNSVNGEGPQGGQGDLRIAANATSNAQRWNIKTGSLTMGDANSRLSASDSVNLSSGHRDIRLLGSASAIPVGPGGFKLYQDTIAGINAPVLRLDNSDKGTEAQIDFNTPNGAAVDFTNAANANPDIRLVLNTSGKVTQASNTSVKVKELVAKGQSLVLDTAAGNEIAHLSATVFGGPSQAGVISVKNGTGTITLGGLRDDDKSITDGLNASGNLVVQNSGAPDTVVLANVRIKSTGAIQLAGGITAPEISLETMGSITNTVTQVNTTTVNTNAAVNNPMPILDASSNSSSGVTSIRLLADGNIGDSNNEQSIGVKLGNGGNKVLIGQPTGGTGSNLSAALHFATGPTGTANTSQVQQSGVARDLSLQSEGSWQVDSGLGARSIQLKANNGNVSFASGTVTGSLQGTNFVFVDAEKGAILGDPNANTYQVRSDVVGLIARDGVSAKVDAGVLFARSEGGTGATGSQDINISNSNNDPWTLAHAYSANGNININSNGLVKVQGEYPFPGSADLGKPLGVEGNSVSITGGGINVHRSIIARSGSLSLNAGTKDLNISRMPTFLGASSTTPDVVLEGASVSLKGDKVQVSDNASPTAALNLNLPVENSNDPAPSYPTASSGLAAQSGVVKVGATTSLSVDASSGIDIVGDSTLAAQKVDLHTSAGNVALSNTNAIKGTNAVFVSAEAGAITGDFNATSPQVSSAVVSLIARDGVSAQVDAGVLFARSNGGTGAVANAQDVNVRNTRSDWTLAAAASAGGNVTVVTSGHMRVQGEFPYAGADLGKPLGVEGNNVTLFADGGIDVHRSVIARSGNLVVDARNSNLLIAPKSTDLSTQPTPEVHLGGVSVNLYGQNITVTETPVTSTTPFTFSAPNTNSLSAPAYPALLGSVATDPGTVKIKATSTATLVANGTVDLQARNGLQADNMVSVEANGGAITGSNTGTAPQIKANMVTLSARDAINTQVDTSLLLAVSKGGAGATGSQNVNITNNRSDWVLAAASSAGGNVNISGSGRIRVSGESPLSGNDLGAPLGVTGNAVSITAGNGLDVNRSVVARNGNLDLNAGAGDLLIAPKTTQFGKQSTPQVHLGGQDVNLAGRNVVISAIPVSTTGPVVTYGSSSLMPYPALGGSIASEPGAVKVGATNALSITATSGITLQGGNNSPVADAQDVVSPAGSAVRLVAPSVNLTAQSLQVNGGAGNNAYASIQYSTALNLAISGGGSAINLVSGAGSNADAVVFSTASTSTLNTNATSNMTACTTCPPTWYQGENPLNDSTTHTGLGVSTTARPSALTVTERAAVQTTTQSNVSEQSTITQTLVNTNSDDQPTSTTSSTEERKEKAKESVVVEAQGNVCT